MKKMTDKCLQLGGVVIQYTEMPPAAQKEFDDFGELMRSPMLTTDEKWERVGPYFERMEQLIFN